MLSNFRNKPKNETFKVNLDTEDNKFGDFIELKSFSDKKFLDEIGRKTAGQKNKSWKEKVRNSSTDKDFESMCASMARHLVVDWQLTDDKEEFKSMFPDIKVESRAGLDKKYCSVPYCFENVFALLTHKEYETFTQMVYDETRDEANYIKRELDAEAGN